MPDVSQEEMMAVLRKHGLEEAGKGVVFQWGLKVVDFNGRKALQQISAQEYKDAVFKDTGRVLADSDLLDTTCTYGEGTCHSSGCAGYCSLRSNFGYYYCLCIT